MEVQYDEFTADVRPNRLVKAAAHRLARVRLRSAQARRNMGWLASMLEDVLLVDFPSNCVPAVPFDRLNEHYRGAVELSRLILRHGAFESRRGAVRTSGFLMDMNVVFQEFTTQALREALRVSPDAFRESPIPALDCEGHIRFRPDLTWWEDSSCVFVGDVKYKNLAGEHSVPNADLYQMLAYATALNLPGGLLIYAEGEAAATYSVRHTDKRLEVAALDLSGTLDDALARVEELAKQVVALRDKTRPLGTDRKLRTANSQ